MAEAVNLAGDTGVGGGTGRVAPNKQTQVSPQDTFRYTTPDLKVVANPLDQMVKPAQQLSYDVDKLVAGLNSTVSHLDASLKEQERVDKEKGEAAYMRGEALPSDASTGFAKGFYTLKGKAAALDYAAELDKLYQEKWSSFTSEEFQAEARKLQAKYLEGVPDAFALGFAPHALEAEGKYRIAHLNQLEKATKEEAVTTMVSAMKADIEAAVAAGGDDPVWRAKHLRDVLSWYQKVGTEEMSKGAVKFSRQEIADIFAEAAGAYGERTGKFTMDWAHVPDENGVAAYDNPDVRKTVDAWQQHIRQANMDSRINQTYQDLWNSAKNARGVVDPQKLIQLASDPDYMQKKYGLRDNPGDAQILEHVRSRAAAFHSMKDHERRENMTQARQDLWSALQITMSNRDTEGTLKILDRAKGILSPTQVMAITRTVTGVSTFDPRGFMDTMDKLASGNMTVDELWTSGRPAAEIKYLSKMAEDMKNSVYGSHLKEAQKLITTTIGGSDPTGMYKDATANYASQCWRTVLDGIKGLPPEQIKQELDPRNESGLLMRSIRTYTPSMQSLAKYQTERMSRPEVPEVQSWAANAPGDADSFYKTFFAVGHEQGNVGGIMQKLYSPEFSGQMSYVQGLRDFYMKLPAADKRKYNLMSKGDWYKLEMEYQKRGVRSSAASPIIDQTIRLD